ncbi:TPA: hypothetical protein ACNTUM_000670 [Escherichia coli]|nr:hypothetical protein [Escherichia coli]HCO3884107.1 hypothetical protein [Escherichia coli]
MTAYHTHESYTQANESGRMVTIYRQRWVNDRIQELVELSPDSDLVNARAKAESDWIEFTDCPF